MFEFSRANNNNNNSSNSSNNNVQQVVHQHDQHEPLQLQALPRLEQQYEYGGRRLLSDMGGGRGGMKHGMAAGRDIKVDTTVVGVRPLYQDMMSYVP